MNWLLRPTVQGFASAAFVSMISHEIPFVIRLSLVFVAIFLFRNGINGEKKLIATEIKPRPEQVDPVKIGKQSPPIPDFSPSIRQLISIKESMENLIDEKEPDIETQKRLLIQSISFIERIERIYQTGDTINDLP